MRHSNLTFLLGLAALAQAVPHAPENEQHRTCNLVLKPQHNPNIRCGWHGPLDQSRVRQLEGPSVVLDLPSCASICYGNPACISFAYNTDDQQCQTFSKSLLNMGIAEPDINNGTTVYYNIGCWSRRCSPKACICTARSTETTTVLLGTRYMDSTVFATKTKPQKTSTLRSTETLASLYAVNQTLNWNATSFVVPLPTSTNTLIQNFTITNNFTAYSTNIINTTTTITLTPNATATIVERDLITPLHRQHAQCTCKGNASTTSTTITKTVIRPSTLVRLVTRYNATYTPPPRNITKISTLYSPSAEKTQIWNVTSTEIITLGAAVPTVMLNATVTSSVVVATDVSSITEIVTITATPIECPTKAGQSFALSPSIPGVPAPTGVVEFSYFTSSFLRFGNDLVGTFPNSNSPSTLFGYDPISQQLYTDTAASGRLWSSQYAYLNYSYDGLRFQANATGSSTYWPITATFNADCSINFSGYDGNATTLWLIQNTPELGTPSWMAKLEASYSVQNLTLFAKPPPPLEVATSSCPLIDKSFSIGISYPTVQNNSQVSDFVISGTVPNSNSTTISANTSAISPNTINWPETFTFNRATFQLETNCTGGEALCYPVPSSPIYFTPDGRRSSRDRPYLQNVTTVMNDDCSLTFSTTYLTVGSILDADYYVALNCSVAPTGIVLVPSTAIGSYTTTPVNPNTGATSTPRCTVVELIAQPVPTVVLDASSAPAPEG